MKLLSEKFTCEVRAKANERVTEIARGVLMANFCEVNTGGGGTTRIIHLHIAMKPQPTDNNGAPLPWKSNTRRSLSAFLPWHALETLPILFELMVSFPSIIICRISHLCLYFRSRARP